MAVEVPCPNCQSILRAPDDIAGKRVKCKKCDHRFVIPGATKADSVGDSQLLSVVDQPIPMPASPPAPVGPAAAFSFDAGGGGEEAAPMISTSGGRAAKKSGRGGSNWILILGGVAFALFLMCAGGLTALYFLVLKPPANQVAAITAIPTAQPMDGGEKAPVKGKETKGKAPKTITKAKETPPTMTEPVEPDNPMPAPMPKVGPMPKQTGGKNMVKPEVASGGGAAGKTFTMPGPADVNAKLITAPKTKISLEIPAATVRDVVFLASKPPLIGVLWNSALGFQGSGMKDSVSIFSAQTAIRVDNFEFAVEGTSSQRVFDVGPEGVKFVSATSKDKLYIHNLEAKAPLMESFNPFTDMAVKRMAPPAATRFFSGTSLLIADSLGGIDQWDLMTKQKVGSNPPLTTNPGRVFLGEASGKSYVYAGDTVTPISLLGQRAGNGITVSPGSQALGLGVDAGGDRVAVAYQSTGKPLYGLAILNFKKNGISHQLALPEGAGIPVDAGCFTGGLEPQAMIVTNNRNNAVMYDAENDVAAAYLSGAPGKPVQIFADGPNGRLWWITADPADPKKSLLLGVDANFDGYSALVDAAGSSKKPVPILLRADGIAR